MPNLKSLVAKQNPFYLLSALSMLLGCLLLSRALALEPGHGGKLVLLIGVLNLYEGLLIGLALFLIMKRGLVHDGRLLLWLESIFLVDATFLGSELYASDLGTGALVAGALFLLVCLKLVIIVRGLGVPFGPPQWLALVPLGALFAVPGLFATLAPAHLLTLPLVYILWWVLSLLMVAQAVAERSWPEEGTSSPGEAGAGALRDALSVVPFASLAAHLLAGAWVQCLDFHPNLLGPPLVALGLRSLLRDLPGSPGKGGLWWPAAAAFVSLGAPAGLVVPAGGGILLSPLRVTLIAVGLAYLLAFRIHRTRDFAWAAGSCLAGAAAGHSLGAMVMSLGGLVRSVFSRSGRLFPRTAGQWGLLTVGLSFVLLALGARLSLRRDSPIPRDSREI